MSERQHYQVSRPFLNNCSHFPERITRTTGRHQPIRETIPNFGNGAGSQCVFRTHVESWTSVEVDRTLLTRLGEQWGVDDHFYFLVGRWEESEETYHPSSLRISLVISKDRNHYQQCLGTGTWLIQSCDWRSGGRTILTTGWPSIAELDYVLSTTTLSPLRQSKGLSIPRWHSRPTENSRGPRWHGVEHFRNLVVLLQ